MKVFGHKKFQLSCTGSKVPNWQFQKWHYWPWHSKLNFFMAKYLHLNFFHNVLLPLPEFVSIPGKKAIFSKGHPYSISIFVSYCSPIMWASFKSKIWNVFCLAIFLRLRMVCFIISHQNYQGTIWNIFNTK